MLPLNLRNRKRKTSTMCCPVCSSNKVHTISTSGAVAMVNRRKKCLDCSARWSTVEKVIFSTIKLDEKAGKK